MAKYIITDILVRIIHKEENTIPIDYADDIVEMIDADLNGEIASTENVPYAVTVERISEAVKIKKKEEQHENRS